MAHYRQTYSYSYPTDIRFGPGVIAELPGHLSSKGLRRPLLVTDPTVSQLPFFSEILESMQAANLTATAFSDTHKNPIKSDVVKGVASFREADCDCIVGIGGGVAMDVGRAVVLAVNHHRDLFDYDDLQGGDKYVTEAVPYFVTVPTTSGTGSEVGRSAIISEDDTGKKRILFHPSLMAKQVFADPVLTHALPAPVTAATGMDALTHNMEAYLAKGHHPMADGIALEGMALIARSIRSAVNAPGEEARFNMMMGSMMGAVAFQKGLGIVHSLAHPLSTLRDVHHGLANAMMLPYGMRFNFNAVPERFERMATAMGLDGGQALVDFLFGLNRDIGLSSRLRDEGVAGADLEKLSELAVADFCHPSNPVAVRRQDFLQLYKEAL